jgi:tyrosyl-tRNA synthetase
MSSQPGSSKTGFLPVEEQLVYLRKGAAEIIREEEFVAKLTASRASGKPLRVKLGVDPTAPDIHLGHTVVLRKLKHFQDMGHTAVFLIGDFTAMVGDPTGQSVTRPPLSREQVKANAETYLSQVFKILDKERTEVRYNTEWLDKLTGHDMIMLCAKYRLARMLEHEDFSSRLANKQPISVHELIYPLLVAYDSVVLKADVELGATEQKFNLLMGREIQREYGQPLQIAMTMPILVGLDGERKMSKSLGNYVGITEAPGEMFGKLMSISDEQMWLYMDLLTDRPPAEIARLRRHVADGHAHPMDVKIELAQEIVTGFHNETAAVHAVAEFRKVFQERGAPSDMPLKKLTAGTRALHALLTEAGLAPSRSEAERLIKQGGVEINGTRVEDVKHEVKVTKGAELQVRAGKKKFLRITAE